MKADIVLKKELLKGNPGGYYVPNVDEEYNLSFTPTLADMPQVESTNIKDITLESFLQTAEYNSIVEAEQARKTAETSRATAEAKRSNTEANRAAAEAARTQAEANRATEETERAAAELGRTQAEQAREANYNASMNEWEAAVNSTIGKTETAEANRTSVFNTSMTQWETKVNTTVSTAKTDVAAAVEDAENATAAATNAIGLLMDNAHSPAITPTFTGEIITVNDAAEQPLAGLSIYGKTTQDGTPTPENPIDLVNIGNGGSIGVNVCGKNLAKMNVINNTTNGITVKTNSYGEINIKGTATALVAAVLTDVDFITAGKYVLCPARQGRAYIDIIANKTQIVQSQATQTMTFIINSGDKAYARVVIPEGETVDTTFYFAIYPNTVKNLDYEPYKNGGSLTINIPNGLPAIPVSSGGNYTDENGQQWIADEIDLGKGVYRKNVPFVDASTLAYTTTNTANVFTAKLPYPAVATAYGDSPAAVMMCNTLPPMPRITVAEGKGQGITPSSTHMYICIEGITTLSELNEWFELHPTKFIYKPSKIIGEETQLTTDEITAYQALTTQKPNTNIYNNASAGMAATYIADTKIYIDNKFNELSTAIVAMGGI